MWTSPMKRVSTREAREGLLSRGQHGWPRRAAGISPLGIAVGFNRLAVVSLLLQKGAEVDRRDSQGNTVLHYAAGMQHAPSCEGVVRATGEHCPTS